MTEEREDENAVQGVDRPPRPKAPIEHDAEAWRLYCAGCYVWTTIAEAVNEKFGSVHNHAWAERAVQRHSKVVRAMVDNEGVDSLAEYIEGLRQDLAHQNSIANTTKNAAGQPVHPQYRSAARKRVTEIRELIAAARGTVTKRQGTNLSSDPDNPPTLEVIIGGNGHIEPSSNRAGDTSEDTDPSEADAQADGVPE